MPRRSELVAMGWGIAPIYVGQQVTGPGSHLVTGAQGKIDGADAAKKVAQCGFPSGSFVYLDLENGPPFTAAQHAYVGAWMHIAENERQAWSNRVMRLVEKRGTVSRREIQMHLRGALKAAELKDILDALIEAGRITVPAAGQFKINT